MAYCVVKVGVVVMVGDGGLVVVVVEMTTGCGCYCWRSAVVIVGRVDDGGDGCYYVEHQSDESRKNPHRSKYLWYTILMYLGYLCAHD